MFVVIIGVLVAVAADAIYTYHVSVCLTLVDLRESVLMGSDRWILCRRASLYQLIGQLSCLLW